MGIMTHHHRLERLVRLFSQTDLRPIGAQKVGMIIDHIIKRVYNKESVVNPINLLTFLLLYHIHNIH